MPRQNRVTPHGALIDLGRGMFMGNRGCLHDDAGQIRRAHRGRRWIICALEFKGRRLELAAPGENTQLFFLDEATALAAGHRPCGECRRDAFRAFVDAWTAGNPGALPAGPLRVGDIDRVLHQQRTGPRERAPLNGLPDGTLVALDDDPLAHLVLGDALLPWQPEGYGAPRPRPATTVDVLTPPSTVNALRAGYRPVLHPSANQTVQSPAPVTPAEAPAAGEIRIRRLRTEDVEPILEGFREWGYPRPREQLERYLAEQESGEHLVLVAVTDGEIGGYGTVCWTSDYPPFRDAGIPEIRDLNVWPRFRRRGIASRILDEAERLIGERGRIAGIGVGLYRDYGPAQRLYVLRGYVPDGLGAVWRNQPVLGGAHVPADDDLVIHLTKSLPSGALR